MFDFLPADEAVVTLYRDMIPARVFDAHAHLHDAVAHTEGGIFRRPYGSVEGYRADMSPYLPGAELTLHAIPMPEAALRDLTNGRREAVCLHVSREAALDGGCIASLFAHAKDSVEELSRLAELPAARAIKCYFYTAGKKSPEDCEIADFLPEAAWEVSAARGLPIVLHMMHEGALADDRNYQYVTHMAKKYPAARLVLAHCGRAFAAWTGLFRISSLADLGNVWFDLAAVCEVEPMMACLKAAPLRTMWGSDYPICMHRGRAVSFGTGFSWVIGDLVPKGASAATVAAENLFALYRSALLLDLDTTDVHRVFYGNAQALFAL